MPTTRDLHCRYSMVFALLGSVACDDWGPGGKDDTGNPEDLMEAETYGSFGCVEDFVFGSSDDRIDNLYLYGSDISPGETPGDALLVSPCDLPFTSAPIEWNETSITDLTDGTDRWMVAFVTDDGDPVTPDTTQICDEIGEAAWSTFYFHLPMHSSNDCEDYGVLEWAHDPYPAMRSPPPPNNGGEDSTSSACTAGSGRFKMGKYQTWDTDGDGTGIIRRFLVQQSGDSFPERAWIREVDVVSWGVSEELVFGKVHHWMEVAGDTLSLTNAVRVSTLNPVNFAEGVMTMGTFVAEDGFDLDDATGTPPLVDLEWTCGVPEPPHFSVLNLPQIYGDELEDLTFVSIDSPHKVTAFLNENIKIMHVALEGRHWDGWQIPVTDIGGGEYSFDYQFSVNQVSAVGTVSTTVNTMTIEFEELEIGGVSLGTPTVQLPAL